MASSDGSDSRLRAQLVATIEGLEKEDEDVPNTRFPRLDTLDPCVKGRSRTPSNKTELLSLDLPASDHSNSANGSEGSCFDLKSCLERYSRFIIDFTGEEAVSFLCTLNDDMLGIVCGRRPTGELRDLQWKPRLTAVVGHHSGRASDQNFSLSLGSSDPFASSNGVKHAEDIVVSSWDNVRAYC